DECVLESWLINSDVCDGQVCFCHFFADYTLGRLCISREKIQTITESLDINNCFFWSADRRKDAMGLAEIRGAQLETFRIKTGSNFIRCAGLLDFAVVHQRNAMTSLRLVQIRSRHENRQATGREVRESIPEFAARHGIDASRGFIQQ